MNVSSQSEVGNVFDWDPDNLGEDDEFYRSRVPLQPRISSSVRANSHSTANDDRRLVWWCPMGDRAGDVKGSVRTTYSLPRPTFEIDAFSMWQYLEAHGAAAAVQGTFAGAAIDQAHRHGVKVLAYH
ncbi:MAG: hypothetical protein GDA42_10775 [Ekhidna sp.]|nr:hypothetical protein [Ekhidna sp.]